MLHLLSYNHGNEKLEPHCLNYMIPVMCQHTAVNANCWRWPSEKLLQSNEPKRIQDLANKLSCTSHYIAFFRALPFGLAVIDNLAHSV